MSDREALNLLMKVRDAATTLLSLEAVAQLSPAEKTIVERIRDRAQAAAEAEDERW